MPRRSAVIVLFALSLVTVSLSGCHRKPDLAHRVQDRIHAKLPAATVNVRDSSTLEVKLGEQAATISLDNLAMICQRSPDQCDEMIDRYVQNLASLGEAEKPVAPDELRVVLRSRQTVEDNKRAILEKSPPDKVADNQLVTFPFVGDMMLVLVRDMPEGIGLMNHGALAKMPLDEAKARAIGTANLEKALGSLPTEPAAPGVFRVRANDSYEAARILVPKLWDGLAKQVSGELLVVAPTRDIVYAAGSQDAAAVTAMRALAKKDFEAGPYSLSTAVLRRTDAGFVLAAAPSR